MNETVREWVRKADGDCRTAERELRASDAPNYDAACFHAQQCIEKLMKAVLIHHGVEAPRTHDLVALSHLVTNVVPTWQYDVESLRFLTRAAVEFRYPGEGAEHADAVEAVAICRKLRDALRPLVSAE